MDYYNIPSVSNSALTQLKYLTSAKDWYDPTNAYLFGSLVDAMITGPSKLNWIYKTLDEQPIELEMWNKAVKCMKAFQYDKFATQLINNSEFQKVSISNRIFNVNDFEFELNCKCKWDFFGKNISGDIKTTMARTQKEFEAVCNYFEYYRGRAWYMDLENTDNDILIGISKVNYKIFYVRIKRGDENYLKGKSQYEELALKYYLLM
jgi:hypothetical protein